MHKPPPGQEFEDAPNSFLDSERQFPGLSGVGALMKAEELGLRAQLAALQTAHEVLRSENEALRRQLAGPLLGEAIDCALIKPSRFYSRCEMDFNSDLDIDFRKLVFNIRIGGGNSIPAILLRIEEDPFQYEIISGHRRWAACRAAGVPLRAFVKEGLSLKEIAKLQLAENRNRISSSAQGADLRPL